MNILSGIIFTPTVSKKVLITLIFRFVFPLSFELAGTLLHDIVERIKSGERFESGSKYAKIISEPYKVEFIYASEGGRKF